MLKIPSLLLVMCYVLSRTMVDSISTCHTKVYMKGDNNFVLFHVEEEELIEPMASQFCVKHLVDHTECQRIVQYHKQHCFQEQNETVTTSITSENEEQRVVDEGMFQTQTIDYAEKIGPILQIFLTDGTLTANLQAVAGETKEQSIIRFCGMLKMSDHDCRQVAEKYEQLLKKQEEVNSSEDNHPTMKEEDFQHGNVDTTKQNLHTEQPSDLFTFGNQIVQQAKDMLNYWWKWIVLVVAIYYCYLIQQPHLFRDGGWED